jgi:protein-disulfide isomerase
VGQSSAGSAPPVIPYRTIATQQAFKHAVVEIVEWSCPYCRQINDGAVQWGKTLPKGWVFVQMPVITDKESLRAAGLFAGLEQVADHRLAALGDALFSLTQDRGADPSNPQILFAAARTAGINPQTFVQKNTAARVRATTREWLQLQRAVKPERTPTFVVAGSQVTDVSMTGGRYDLLFQLLSGLVSQHLVQKG